MTSRTSPLFLTLYATALLLSVVLAFSSRAQERDVASETVTGFSAPVATVTPDPFTGALRIAQRLQVPPGRNGMTPELLLSYSSGGGNGPFGVGFRMPMGEIQRESRTGINYTDSDFVYRGAAGVETLISTGGERFATKVASRFERFESRPAADGRRSWTMTDVRGVTSDFGITDESRLSNPDNPDQIFSWCLSRVTDPNGNAITLKYVKHGGQIYLHKILYTEAPGIAANIQITFVTESRPDVETSLQLKFSVVTALRVKQVLIEANASRMPSYELQYAESVATGRSLLQGVVLRAPAGQQMPATQFSYQGETVTFDNAIWSGGGAPGTPALNCLAGDFDGNSYGDIACHIKSGSWSMSLSNGTGWSTTTVPGPNVGVPVSNQCRTGDMNLDGRDDVICYSGKQGVWHRMLGSDGGWGSSTFIGGPAPGIPIGKQCLSGDFNGDGRLDLACFSTVGDQWHVVYATDGGFTGEMAAGPKISDAGAQCTALDFDADRRTDIVCYSGSGNDWKLWRSREDGWFLRTIRGPVAGLPVSDRCYFGHWNSDLRPDTLCFTGVGNLWHMGFNSSEGFEGPSVEMARIAVPVTRHCAAIDVTGDGRTDVLCFTGSGALYHIAVAHERSFKVEAVVNGPLPGKSVGANCVPGDFSGDGKGDLACHSGGGTWSMALSDGISSDLLSRIRTPLGGTTSFEYGRAAAMPGNRVPLALDVLASVTRDDGMGTIGTTTYTYSGALYDIADRDFRGYRRVIATEPGGGAVTRSVFHQGSSTNIDASPVNAEGAYMRGKPARVRVFTAAGALLRETNFAYAESTSFPRFNALSEVGSRFCDGDEVCQETRTTLAYDAYGNIVQETHHGDVAFTGDEFTRTYTYARNVDKHIVALRASEEVRAGVGGGARLLFTETFYDGSGDTCLQPSGSGMPARGNATLVRQWIADGAPPAETLTAFDAQGNAVCTRDPLGARTTFELNARREFVLASVNALGHRTSWTYYGIAGAAADHGYYGQLRTVQDANGAIARKEYDVFGREVRDISSTGASTTYSYIGLGKPGAQHVRADHSAGLSVFTYLDGEGREVRSRRSGAGGRFVVKTTRYDARGLVIGRSLPYYEDTAPIGESTTTYDALRQPILERDASGAERLWCRQDGITDMIDPNGSRTREVRTAGGRLLRMEAYSGRYAHGCPPSRVAGNAGEAPYAVTRYSHDPLGRQTGVIDAKGAGTTIEYDGIGHRVRVVDPYTGERRFVVDAKGNVLRITTASGNTIHAIYDLLGRIVQKSFGTARPLGQGDILWVYDEPRSNGIGHLTSTSASEVRKAIHYDSGGRVVRVERTIAGTTYAIAQSYDELGRVLQMTYPDGGTILYHYDGPVLARVTDGVTVYARFGDHTPLGAPGRIAYGNGVITVQTFEVPSNAECPRATYRLCSSTTTGPTGTLLLHTAYQYDRAGNVTMQREPAEVRRFEIDDFGRLVRTTRSIAGGPAVEEERLEYDPADNITWKTGLGAYSYAAAGAARQPHAPQRVGDNLLVHDPDGNMIGGFGRTYAYTMEGQLAAVWDTAAGTTQYFYDEDRSMVREGSAAGSKIYVGGLYECVSGRCVKEIYAGSMKIATVASGGLAAYVHLDAQGNTRVVTNTRGGIEVSYRYTAFGMPSAAGAMPQFVTTLALYGGHLFASRHGIHVMGGRPYDPRFGRFLSPDPLFIGGGPMATLNRLAYAFNNPSTFIDPDGQFPWGVLIGAVIGAVIGGTNAYLSGGDWKQGALIGAITGAFTGGAYEFAQGLGGVARAVAFSAAGAASGATSAALGGGDILVGAGAGALFGLGTGGINHQLSNVWVGFAETPVAGIASQLAQTALRGAAFGGLRAAVTGENIWAGMREGALQYALGEVANMGVGHTIGLVWTGKLPDWKHGSFIYDAEGFDGAITFSNVINADLRHYRGPSDWAALMRKEIGHTWQSLFLGPAYIPVHALSQVASYPLSGFESVHRWNLFERVWHPYPHWD